ncbi:MAG: M16 family metallopeptidase [Thermonemataceae bacterium]
MNKRIILWAIACLICLQMNAQNKIEFIEYDLPNGLHVILHEDKSVPTVMVSVLYHVGSKNEDPNRTGFAHFFEHLMFEGSANIDRGEFDKYLDEAGGVNNANTSQDRTFYFEVLPANQLELALWMESERMLHAKVDKKGIETQREVVKEEKRQRIDNQPYGSILEEVMKRAYTKHPYRWTPIGSMEHIDAAKEVDFKNFYATYYVPNNATLSIAGNIDIKQTKKWIDLYFGGIPKGKDVPRPNVEETAQIVEIRDVVYDNIQLPAVIHAFKIPNHNNEDYYAISMLMQLLSQGESSRFNKSIKTEQEKALFVGAFPFDLEDEPNITITFGIVNAGVKPEDLEKAMEAEYVKVKNELISENEFQKLRNQIENDFYTSNATVQGIAESLANYHVYYGDANLINTEIDRYMKVKREDIQRVAKKYLKRNNRVTLYYLPKQN